MVDAVIVSTARTPIGRAVRGAFNLHATAPTWRGRMICHAVKRAGIDPASVEDRDARLRQSEGATGGNIARQAAIRAGLPVTSAAQTINRFCSSGLQAIILAARSITPGRRAGGGGGRAEVDQPGADEPQHEVLSQRLDRRAQGRCSTCR